MQHTPEAMIQANGIEICTEAFGNPKDPAILLIMGAGASMILWEMNFIERLVAGGRFVIRYDNRDTGCTTCCPPGAPNYSLQTLADDAVAVLDHFNVERAHIMGASMGGMITQLVGLNHADRALTLTPIMSSPAGGAVVDAMNGKAVSELSPPSAEVMAAVANDYHLLAGMDEYTVPRGGGGPLLVILTAVGARARVLAAAVEDRPTPLHS